MPLLALHISIYISIYVGYHSFCPLPDGMMCFCLSLCLPVCAQCYDVSELLCVCFLLQTSRHCFHSPAWAFLLFLCSVEIVWGMTIGAALFASLASTWEVDKELSEDLSACLITFKSKFCSGHTRLSPVLQRSASHWQQSQLEQQKLELG